MGRLGEMMKFVCDDVYFIERTEVATGSQLRAWGLLPGLMG